MATILLIEDEYDANHYHVYNNLGTICFAFSLHADDVHDILGPDVIGECVYTGTVRLEVETHIQK